jgi:hypothetical protein
VNLLSQSRVRITSRDAAFERATPAWDRVAGAPRLEMILLARPGSLHQRPVVLKTGTDSRKFKSMTDQPCAQTRFGGFSHRVARYNN